MSKCWRCLIEQSSCLSWKITKKNQSQPEKGKRMARLKNKDITTNEAMEIIGEQLDSMILLMLEIKQAQPFVLVERQHLTMENLMKDFDKGRGLYALAGK